MLHRVALVRTDVSEEPGASFIRVTKIGELGTTQAATSNRRRTSVASCLCRENLKSYIGITLAVTSNRRTLRRNTKWEMKLVFFMVTAVKTSNFTKLVSYGKRLLAPRPNPKLEDRSLLFVRGCLFNIFAATLNCWRLSLPSATRGRAALWWQGDQPNMAIA
jgi:hypothetical protein